ncbi:TraK domain-containing protein [Candidatus Odyssella thessalonicensis]|uniref:TraK domain-containing protein n=1 Tax=Candidatus Odyssella thessalonicensis TaxID=84647 RepID=UPI000225ACDE|nr:type-F conjugative transfer system secretin TraK [Candidatus Odyssella thessalonicensis]
MINRKINAMVVGLGIYWATALYAGSQVIHIDANTRLEATIARDYLNRIAASNDRITEVFGDEATYAIQTDEVKGQIFIKPSEANGLKPISLTLITESGQVQDLTLKPSDQGSATVILKGSKKSSPKVEASAQYLESPLPVQEKMIRAMKMLVLSQFPESDRERPDRKEVDGVSIRHKKSFHVGPYQGHHYELTNTTETLLDLDEKAFYQIGDLALSLGAKVLQAQGSTSLWVIHR